MRKIEIKPAIMSGTPMQMANSFTVLTRELYRKMRLHTARRTVQT